MKKQISMLGANIKSIDLDTDIYCRIVDYRKDFCKLDKNNDICLINKKGIKIPIWRIVRNCWDKRLGIRYLDNDKTNLVRDNLRIIRRVNV